MKTLKESIDPNDFAPKDLTNDCYFVFREGGTVDLVSSQKRVDIFDIYWDLGVKLVEIRPAGGHLNPRIAEPRIK